MDCVQLAYQEGVVGIQPLLDELCVDLGFCLPPAEQAHLRQAPLVDVDQFTDAVFVAEGLSPDEHKDLRSLVRVRVDRFFMKVK